MLAKLASPLSSPTLAAAQLRNRLPTQLRRLLPYYIGCIIFVLVFLNLNLFHTGKQQIVLVRPPSSDSTHPTGSGSAVATTRPFRSEFPKKIWQTWKVTPLAFEERDRNNARSWTEQNPDWRYEVITDGNEMQYVEYHFGPEGFNRPDIVEFYRSVQAAIIKADLLRYLIMYAEGGIYADIDVEALKPMSRFIPDRYSQKDIDMVVGVEIDEPDWKDHPILGPKSMSFCQWTFMCKPELPVMMHLVEHIMTWLNGVATGQNRTISDVELDFDEVISGTGPSAFTNAILAEMNTKHTGGVPVEWSQFHDIPESKLVSNVLVLTVEAFAAGQGHSNSGNHEARAALVRHHYHASNWPSRHPRYKHPAYGEVENCNWNDECVHKWDENVAAFEHMNEDDKQRVIAEEDRKREEEERKRKEEDDERRRKEDEDRAREDEERRQEEERRRKEEEDRRAQEEREKEHANPGAAPENAAQNPDAKSPAAEKEKPAP